MNTIINDEKYEKITSEIAAKIEALNESFQNVLCLHVNAIVFAIFKFNFSYKKASKISHKHL